MGKIWRLIGCLMIINAVHHIITFPREDEFWTNFWLIFDSLGIIAWTVIITFEGKK